MKSFFALMQKEWTVYRVQIFVMFVLSLLLMFVVPYLIDKNMEMTIPPEQVVFSLMLLGLVLATMGVVMQLMMSLKADVRRKEMWLHSPQSIYQLVGAKMLFNWCVSAVFTLTVLLIGLSLVSTYFGWSMAQVVVASIAMSVIVLGWQIFLLVFIQIFYSLYLQMQCYIGRFAIAVTVPLVALMLFIMAKFEESALFQALFQHGYVSLEPLERYLQPTDDSMFILIGSMYIVQELFYICLLIACFLVSAKWLEKVVSRS